MKPREKYYSVSDESKKVLDIVKRYSRTWQLLVEYDEDNLQVPAEKHTVKKALDLDDARQAIAIMKKQLLTKGALGTRKRKQ